MLDIAGDISSAAGAAAGLILVFFGSALSSFDSYDETQKGSVRSLYRRRAWPAFAALFFCVMACGISLAGKVQHDENMIVVSAYLLGAAGVGILVSATVSLMEIG